MKHETAGDQITGLKWTRRTTRKLANELCSIGINVGKDTVGKLLRTRPKISHFGIPASGHLCPIPIRNILEIACCVAQPH